MRVLAQALSRVTSNFLHGAMSSAASSSAGSAERPATVSGSFSSAEQPGTPILSAEQPATPSYSKILSIRDVQRWLTKEPIASSNSADAQRIRESYGSTHTHKQNPYSKQAVQHCRPVCRGCDTHKQQPL